jgi:hypothetical protein
MCKPKERKKLFFVFGMALVLMMLLVASQTFAFRPPAPLTLDVDSDGIEAPEGAYVPQNVGIYDKYYSQFDEPECRTCHGANLAPRHHLTYWYYIGDCLHCHTVIPAPPDVEAEHNCTIASCHPATTILGGGGPHHATDLADSDQCTQCHSPNLLVETWSVPPESGPPDSAVMPRPWTCENCHWHKVNPHSLPDDIQANGPVTLCPNGGVNPALDLNQRFLPTPLEAGLHHQVDEKVYSNKCFNCHSSSPEHDPDFTCEADPSGMQLYRIRYCENCHSEDSLHGIEEHVTAGHGLTVNEKCVACHGSYPTGEWETPALGPEILDTDFAWPGNEGSSGMIVKVFGSNFGQRAPKNPDGTERDWIRIGSGAAGWYDMPVYSWSDEKIEAKIPSTYGGGLPPGATYNIRVHKAPITALAYPGGTDTSPGFSVDYHPDVLSINPLYGVYNTNITVNSVGPPHTFGTSMCDIPCSGLRSGTGTTTDEVSDDKLTDGTKAWTAGQWVNSYVTVEGERNDAGEVYPRLITANDATSLTIDGEWEHIVGLNKNYCIAAGQHQYIWGHCYYVKFESGVDDYRMGCYRGAWLPSRIQSDMVWLYDENDNITVPHDPFDNQYFEGDWNVYVVHEYFIDDGDGWHYNATTCNTTPATLPDMSKAPGYIDTGDKIIEPHEQNLQNWYYREISDPPVRFTIVDTPYINCIRPCNGPAGTIMSVLGENFGVSQGQKTFRFGANAYYAGNVRIKLWSNTKIKFKVPNLAKNRNYAVYIISEDGVTESNHKKFYLKP